MPFFRVFSPFKIRPSQLLTYILTIAVVFSLTLVAAGSWNIRQISAGFEQNITTDIELQKLSGDIIHLDEVLTMSARMAAATGDLSWEARYRSHEPKLDKVIKQVIQIAPESTDGHADQTDIANQKLVAMENQAFDLVRQGQSEQASAILFSPAYEQQKEIYADGIHQTTQSLELHIQNSLDAYSKTLQRSNFFSLVSFPTLGCSWITILFLVKEYIRRQQRTERKLRATQLQLEDGNYKLRRSEMELRQKAATLENTLQQLQQTQVKMVQSEKMSSLGQLVAGVAHEINNPVSFIYGNLEYLTGSVKDLLQCIHVYQQHAPEPAAELQQQLQTLDLDFLQTDLPKLLASMSVGADRIHQIVLSLRNFSRMDESECKTVDIHEGLDSTLLILQHRLNANAERPAIHVTKHYEDHLPLVECYVGPLNQVFMNILSNAIDALEERNLAWDDNSDTHDIGQIMIQTAQIGGDWIQIAIVDNGPGIPQDLQPKIFEPFFTTKVVGKGTGMGMPISYQIIVDRHMGTLDCVSTPGLGTKFVIRIPQNLAIAHPTKSNEKERIQAYIS